MRKAPRRTNDPDGTRRNIVEVATREFAQKGYSGARVDAIASRTRTSKRMIYYYFGGKEGLYLAVLEEPHSSLPPSHATLDRATFSMIFRRDMTSGGALATRRAQIVDIILGRVSR